MGIRFNEGVVIKFQSLYLIQGEKDYVKLDLFNQVSIYQLLGNLK